MKSCIFTRACECREISNIPMLHSCKLLMLLLLLACLPYACRAQGPPDHESTVQMGNCDRLAYFHQACPNLIMKSTFVPLGNKQLLLNAMRCDGAMCIQIPANGMTFNQGSCIMALNRVCIGNVTGCCPGFPAGKLSNPFIH
jgi:hypothetical protein